MLETLPDEAVAEEARRARSFAALLIAAAACLVLFWAPVVALAVYVL